MTEEIRTTKCDHKWIKDSYQPEDMESFVCEKCWAGKQVAKKRKRIK